MLEDGELENEPVPVTYRARWRSALYRRCLVGFPWFWPSWPPGHPAMVEARRLVRRHFGEGHPPFSRGLARFLTALAWPPAVVLHLWEIRWNRPAEAVPARRLPGALWAAVRHNVLPGEYYAYEFWRPAAKAHIDDYLYSNEASRLFKLLNQQVYPDAINDKLAFYEMCEAHGLPTPDVLAVFAPNGVVRDFAAGGPPERDLFVKSRHGMTGLSAERLRWDGSGFVTIRGRNLSPGEVGGYLVERARGQRRTLLVQPACANHASLGVEREGALATARLVTGRSTDGVIVPIFAFIYFPRPDAMISQHGSVALIDPASGRLVPAPPPERTGARHWHHRVEHCSQEINALPDWVTALHQAFAAHAACHGFAFVGWDIAFTDEGPKLLEGNANWSADEFQSISGTPLGRNAFAEILAGHLKNQLEE